MKKEEMISYLKQNKVNVDGLTYNQIQKAYWSTKTQNDELPVTRKTVEGLTDNISEKEIEVTKLVNPLPGDKAAIMKDIVELMDILKHKVRGTAEEGKKMIYLHNTYFHRHDSVGCSTCVSHVFNRMMSLYNEYKKYYA